MRSLFQGTILLVTFIVAFFITTIISDVVDRHDGYYNQGLKEANEVSE